MIELTMQDLGKLKSMCLKANDKELLSKILELEDYCYFHNTSKIVLDMDWRKDREKEKEG